MNPNTGFIQISVLANVGNDWITRKRVLPLCDIQQIRELNEKDGYTEAVLKKIKDDLLDEGEHLYALETWGGEGKVLTIVATDMSIARFTKGNKL